MNEQNKQFDSRIRQRVQALYDYTVALEQGDLGTASVVLQKAEYDAVLERMIVELHMASLETTPSIHPSDMSPLQALLHTYAAQEVLAQTQLNGSSPLSGNSTLQDEQEPIVQKGQEAMSTTEYMPYDEQREQYQPERKDKKYRRFYTFFQTLAAVLVVGMIVSGFVLLLAQRHGTTARPGGLPTTPVYKNPLITVASSDGTVYALQPGSGKILWQYATHQEVDSMVQQSGIVFVATLSNTSPYPDNLYSFKASDGKLLWKQEYPLLTGYSTIAVDDNVIAISGGEGDGSLDVVNIRDGSLLWRYVPDKTSSVWADPIITIHNSVIYVRYLENALSSGGIKAFQLRTGKLLWASNAVPIVNTIFFVDTTMYVLNDAHTAIITLNSQNGKIEKTVKLPSDEQPVQNGLNDGFLYVDRGIMTRSPQVCAVRISDGTHLWCSPKYLGGIFGTPVFMNNTLYYSQTEDNLHGKIRVVALDTNNGNVRWQWLSTETNLYSANNFVMTVGYNGILYTTTSHGLFILRGSDGHLLQYLLTNKDFGSFAFPSVPGQTYQYPS